MTMASPATGRLTDHELMGHLLRRAGFGATPDEVDAAVAQGYEATVEQLLHPEWYEPLDIDLSYRYYIEAREARQPHSAQANWIYRMINTRRPLEEKMTLFWHMLFATANSKVEKPHNMVIQLETFRRHALDDFPTILEAMAKDPAMIFWLDNQQNTTGVHNENFGRELLELFSMGVGKYTEEDVKECARAFTGWGLKRTIPAFFPFSHYDMEFEFHPDLHDDGEKTFLGETGRFDGRDVIDIIARQPATARFIAFRLHKFFVSDTPDDDVIAELAEVYLRSSYSIRAVLRALFLSDAFRSERVYFARVKSPVELVAGLMRLTGDYQFPEHGINRLAHACRYMGMELTSPPTVEGWHTGREWIDTGMLMERVNFAAESIQDTSQSGIRRIVERLRERAGPDGEMTAEETVDRCLEMVGPLRVLPSSRQALIDFAASGGPYRLADGAPDQERRVVSVLQLIVATREYQLA
jgi:uncharacterized protein (DUF1800 family)